MEGVAEMPTQIGADGLASGSPSISGAQHDACASISTMVSGNNLSFILWFPRIGVSSGFCVLIVSGRRSPSCPYLLASVTWGLALTFSVLQLVACWYV